MAYRGPLPTLTEADLREQGERATLPPPMPMDELVAGMMGGRDVPPELEVKELPGAEAERVVAEVTQAYLVALGGPFAVPVLRKSAAVVRRAPIDHRAGFIVSLIDGSSSVEDIADLASMPRVECLRILCDLRELGLIDAVKARPSP